MSNRWINALVKFIIVYVIVHAISLIFGFFGGASYAMVWPHLNSVGNAIISIVISVALYFVIWGFFPGQSAEN